MSSVPLSGSPETTIRQSLAILWTRISDPWYELREMVWPIGWPWLQGIQTIQGVRTSALGSFSLRLERFGVRGYAASVIQAKI